MHNRCIFIKMNGSNKRGACRSYAPYFRVISNNNKPSLSQPAPPPQEKKTQATPSPKVSKKFTKKTK